MRLPHFLSTVALTTVATTIVATSFAGQPPAATDAVSAAAATARRAADVEGALRSLEQDGGARREGEGVATALIEAARAFRPIELPASPDSWAEAGLDPSKAQREGDRLVQTLADGTRVFLTLDPDTQAYLERMLDEYNVPHSGVVLIEPSTGRVRALVSHTEADTPIEGLARKSTAPSASVFKVVTAAALLEGENFDPDQRVCYHGGRSSLTKTNIKGSARLDNRCNTLDGALAWSINSIMAKLAYEHLDQDEMHEWAERFGYNQPIPFELPVEVSTAEFVDDPFERARSAAGFWHTYLSPLHGAMIGAALANDGVMMQPSIIDRVEDADGNVLQTFEAKVFREVMKPETAKTLARFMERTAKQGTARRYFNRRGFPDDITVSGKTGTLSNKDPYLGFTWFVGFGVSEETGTEVSVAGLVCNTPTWRIKGGYAASEAVREFFQNERKSNEVAAK
mgnify:CR=1 FL=1